jgi:hypothetical protein
MTYVSISDKPWVIKHAGPDGMREVVTRPDYYLLGYIIKQDRRWLTFDINRNRVGKTYIVKDDAAQALWSNDHYTGEPRCPHLTAGTCTLCQDMAEAIVVVENLTTALETGHWTMITIRRARRFLNRVRHNFEENGK